MTATYPSSPIPGDVGCSEARADRAGSRGRPVRERPLRAAKLALVLALAVLLAGCFLQGKQPATQATPAAPVPAAKSTAPSQPLSVPQTQVEIPPPQPVSDAALAAGEIPQDVPEPAAPPHPVRRSAGPPAVVPAHPEPAAPTTIEEPARAPIQEVLSADESKRLQESAAQCKREIRRLVEQARLRRLNGHELSAVARIEGMVKLSDDAEAKGDMLEADTLAERALVLAKDLGSER